VPEHPPSKRTPAATQPSVVVAGFGVGMRVVLAGAAYGERQDCDNCEAMAKDHGLLGTARLGYLVRQTFVSQVAQSSPNGRSPRSDGLVGGGFNAS